jgi:hypothetical protein
MLPTDTESKHFVLVVGANETAITLMDASTGTHTAQIAAFAEDMQIPVLLDGKDESIRGALAADHPFLGRIAAGPHGRLRSSCRRALACKSRTAPG